MKVIFAQGNPGSAYSKSRHNVGFTMLDRFASHKESVFQSRSKFHADIAEYTEDKEKVLLVKPSTFYNETGISARALLDFYKLSPKDLLVIHDELALPIGTLKTRFDGSDAGNNGIKSLTAHIGPDFPRIRIGIYVPLRDSIHDADFVLGAFSKDDLTILESLWPTIETCIEDFIHDSFEATKLSI